MLRIIIKSDQGIFLNEIYDKDTLTIGRTSQCDIVLQDESISRKHCLVEIIQGDHWITDLESLNGVFVNGEKLPSNTKTLFRLFDSISIGKFEFTLQEESLENNPPPTRPQQHIEQDSTSTRTKQLHPPSSSEAYKSSKDKENPLKNKIVSVLIILTFAGIIYYTLKLKKEEELLSDSQQTLLTPKSKEIKSKNTFLSSTEYAAMSPSCEMKDQCEELKLVQKGEGLVLKDEELFIYINPAQHASLPEYATISEGPNRDILISLELFFKSSLISLYREQTISHIHFIVLNESNQAMTVYRLHPIFFPQKDFVLGDINYAIRTAIEQNDIEVLWKEITKLPSKSI